MFHLFLLCFISFPEKLVRVSSIFSRYMLLLNPTNPSDATYACNSIVYFLLYSYVVINVLLRVFYIQLWLCPTNCHRKDYRLLNKFRYIAPSNVREHWTPKYLQCTVFVVVVFCFFCFFYKRWKFPLLNQLECAYIAQGSTTLCL